MQCNIEKILRKLCSLCILIEHIEILRNPKYIEWLSFSEGLVKQNFSGSKAAHTLELCSSTCGSIISSKTFLKDKAVTKNVSNLTEDIEVFANNTQKRGWTAQIKEDSTNPIGITTNVVILQSNYKQKIQQNEDFSPGKWLYTTTDNNETLLEIQEIESQLSTNVFWPYQYDFQSTHLKGILLELSFDTNNVPCDNISLSLKIEELHSIEDGNRVCA